MFKKAISSICFMLVLGGSIIFQATNSDAISVHRCRQLCNEQFDQNLDESDNNRWQQIDISNKWDECMQRCDELEMAQEAYKKCIREANTEQDKEKCRDMYRQMRPSGI